MLPRRFSRYHSLESDEYTNVWPAFTDLISNAFMILSLFMFFSLVSFRGEPPIIVIPDADEFKFPQGSAQLSKDLLDYIDVTLSNEIKEKNSEYDINVVEIIGHTDGQPNSNNSNLDRDLENVANLIPGSDVQNLSPGSNADLGLIRALAVANKLRTIPELSCLKPQDQSQFKCLQFRAYSAAQLILPSGEMAQKDPSDNPARRRIEIRFTKLGEEEVVK